MQAERTAVDLAQATEVIRYVRSLGPLGELPDIPGGRFYVKYDVHLHRMPKDVFDAMLAVNDDLPWKPVTCWPDPERGDRYWSVTLETEFAAAHFYTEHEPMPQQNVPEGLMT